MVGGAGRPVREALRAVGSFSAVLTAEGATGAGPALVSASLVAEVAAAERRTGGCALDEARLLIAAEALFPVSPVFSVLLSESAATLFVTGVPNVRDIAPDRASSRVPRVEEVISAPAAPAAWKPPRDASTSRESPPSADSRRTTARRRPWPRRFPAGSARPDVARPARRARSLMHPRRTPTRTARRPRGGPPRRRPRPPRDGRRRRRRCASISS